MIKTFAESTLLLVIFIYSKSNDVIVGTLDRQFYRTWAPKHYIGKLHVIHCNVENFLTYRLKLWAVSSFKITTHTKHKAPLSSLYQLKSYCPMGWVATSRVSQQLSHLPGLLTVLRGRSQL